MTSTLSDKIIDYFPHKTNDRIIGQPTYQEICRVHNMVNKNVVSVKSNVGSGNFSMLGLTISPTAYSVLPPTLFAPPPPPTQALIPSPSHCYRPSNLQHPPCVCLGGGCLPEIWHSCQSNQHPPPGRLWNNLPWIFERPIGRPCHTPPNREST